MQPFIGLNDLGDILGEDVSTSDLAVIAIDSSCQIVRDYLGHDVNLATDDIRALDGNDRWRLILPEPPCREVSEVLIDDEAIETADYVVENGSRIRGMYLRRISEVWPLGLGNVQITYSHGWDVEEAPDPENPPDGYERVPSSIRKVALALATRIYSNSGTTAGGATTSLKLGSASQTFDSSAAIALSSTDLITDELRTLNPYVAHAFG